MILQLLDDSQLMHETLRAGSRRWGVIRKMSSWNQNLWGAATHVLRRKFIASGRWLVLGGYRARSFLAAGGGVCSEGEEEPRFLTSCMPGSFSYRARRIHFCEFHLQ